MTGIPAGARRQLAAALATTVVGWGSQFVIFAFLSAYLLRVTGFTPVGVTGILLVFGIASAIGNALGGPASDRAPRLALPVTLAALAGVLIVFSALGHYKLATVLTVFVWGIPGFALIPALQSRVLAVTGQASVLASTLNIAAFNVGIAAGSALGALLVDLGYLSSAPLVAAALAAAAIPISLRRRPRPAMAPAAGAVSSGTER
jgi:DHA1 family inner membrane transport protein